MKPLNVLEMPLDKVALIEASAGTGKTYTMANLYLRLLLGVGCTPMTVEKILVVTFTKAATAEFAQTSSNATLILKHSKPNLVHLQIANHNIISIYSKPQKRIMPQLFYAYALLSERWILLAFIPFMPFVKKC